VHRRDNKYITNFSRNLKENLEGLGIDARIIQKSVLKNSVGRCEMNKYLSGYSPVLGCCEHREESWIP
jgi:hypothetical protein